jgi:alpha-mannosidase
MKSALRLGLLVLALSSVLLFPQQSDLSKDKVLYTVGYAHLDTQWRWDYQTTINEYIWNTMAFNFKLFEKYPDYVFNFSGANRYRMMKEYYPEEFERVKKYVAAGRWFPSGASMEENDVLAPSHESIIRQVLLGSNYFRLELGVTSQEFMIPDCFGFPASLPSILAHCGIQGFSTQKLTWGSAVGIPFNVGTWIGPDGQSVTAALNPGSYGSRVSEDLSANAAWKKRIEDLGAKAGAFTDYMYYGTGDVGGSPTDDSVNWIEKSLKSNRDFKVVSAKSDQMFKDLTPAQKAKLPTFKGELLLTNHSAGSITSQAAMKRWNRKNELAAARAESAAVVGEWLGGMSYPRERMNEAWRLVLGGQFHDIIPGTSIPRAYEFSWNDELVAANQFNAVFADAAGAAVRAMDTQVKGIPFVVANPLAIEREDAVEAQVAFDAAPKAVRVFDRDGKEVPSQVTRTDGPKLTVLFLAKVPSLGYAVFDIRPAETPCALSTGLKATASSLENGKYLVKLDAAGDVVSVFDKIAGRELLSAPARLEFHYERPAQWPAWNMDWEDRVKPASGFVGGPAKITIVENGPARIALAVERESRHSKFVQVVRLSAAGSRDRVEFAATIDWATKESSLKASFPLTVANPKATYNWGVGTVERGNNEPVKFEVPSHQWFDLTDKDGRYGVAVLEDCKYGSDKPADNILRLTLLYTPGVRGSYREQAYQDLGRHEILYALYGHQGDWRAADVNLQGDRLNQPLVVFRAASHIGSAGKALSFLAVNNKDVVVSAVKKAETGDDVIVRVVEAKGKAAKGVELAFAAPVAAAREVNGQEQDLGPAAVKDGKLVFDITPYRLKTFALKLKPPVSPLARAVSTPVDLPYNVDVISADKRKSDGDFDGTGKSFPAELLPDTITSDGIVFKIGPKAAGALRRSGRRSLRRADRQAAGGSFQPALPARRGPGGRCPRGGPRGRSFRFPGRLQDGRRVGGDRGRSLGRVLRSMGQAALGRRQRLDELRPRDQLRGPRPGVRPQRHDRLVHDPQAPEDRGQRSLYLRLHLQVPDRPPGRGEGDHVPVERADQGLRPHGRGQRERRRLAGPTPFRHARPRPERIRQVRGHPQAPDLSRKGHHRLWPAARRDHAGPRRDRRNPLHSRREPSDRDVPLVHRSHQPDSIRRRHRGGVRPGPDPERRLGRHVQPFAAGQGHPVPGASPRGAGRSGRVRRPGADRPRPGGGARRPGLADVRFGRPRRRPRPGPGSDARRPRPRDHGKPCRAGVSARRGRNLDLARQQGLQSRRLGEARSAGESAAVFPEEPGV